jgi:hypothetical protein
MLVRMQTSSGGGGGTELSCTELQDNNYNTNVTTITGLTIGNYYLIFGSAKSTGATTPAINSGGDAATAYIKQNLGLVDGSWSRHNVIIVKATDTTITLTGEFYGLVLTEISIV